MSRIMMFDLPIIISKNKNSKILLNLNVYRNAHFQTLNHLKKEFKRIFMEKYGAYSGKPIENCSLGYTVFFPSSRKTDLSNVASIVDKFASDCLVELGYIIEDNRDIVGLVAYRNGGIDRVNPRGELILTELEK